MFQFEDEMLANIQYGIVNMLELETLTLVKEMIGNEDILRGRCGG